MKKIILFLLLSLAFSIAAAPTGSKSYRISRLQITAELDETGGMKVTENRTFDFHGNFSYAYRNLPLTGRAEFEQFSVSEDGNRYHLDDSNQPGTYSILEKDNEIVIRWNFTAHDETRTFTFSYYTPGIIEKFEDVAVLYYQFISPEWQKSSHQVTVELIPPQVVDGFKIRHWLHGPLTAHSWQESEGVIRAAADLIPAGRFFEVRVLYPVELFPGARQQIGNRSHLIQTEEEEWARQANQERIRIENELRLKEQRERKAAWLMPLLAVIALLIWLVIFFRFGRRPASPVKYDILTQPPDQMPPVLVSYLINQRVITGRALVSTVLDLARRGFLNMVEDQVEVRRNKFKTKYYLQLRSKYYQDHLTELAEFESELLDFLFHELNLGEEMLEIKTLEKKRRRFIKFIEQWKKSVIKLGKEQNWFEKKSFTGANLSLVLGLICTTAGLLLLFRYGVWSLALMITGLLISLLAAFLPTYTRVGRERAESWKAFRRYLIKAGFKATDNESVISHLNIYLVFAVLFGLSRRAVQTLVAFVPPARQQAIMPWYSVHGHSAGIFSPAGFSKSFSTMIGIATSTMSSAAGTGGGASGGGGGGAGSGGGGAG